MPRRSLLPSLLATGLVCLATAPLGAQQGRPVAATSAALGEPTFYADVLPVLQENCQACHQPAGLNMGGMVAPMSLLTYEETRPWAPKIAEVVKEGRMPPWSAAEMHRGTFKGERYLEDDEKATLIAWAEGGAPAGDPQDAPPPPDFVVASRAGDGGWFLGQPDLIVQFDEPYCLDDDIEDLYVDVPAHITADMLPEDRWIQSVEYRPGPAVHHILGGVGGLVPGAAPRIYEEGYGRLFRAGPREITFNMHFHKTPGPGTAVCSNTQAGIIFKKPGEVIRYVTGGSDLGMFDFVIPAGAPSYSASREYTFDHDVEILRLLPHMHLRGKAALYELTYPDGRNRILLHVPDYDFNWQNTYEFREPVLAPAGSTLRFTLWWDNSDENPYNPDPTIDVRWGRPTTAEMGFGYLTFRELEERHIVVGEPIPSDVRENAATADSGDGGN
jgi:mono/diheme cytochrome c family protein